MSDAKERPQPVRNGLLTIDEAIAYGGKLFDTSADFDAALDHVLVLLEDAATLFERRSFGSSVFLSITALEEISKAHVGIFRRDNPGPKPKGGDPFRNHRAKHSMAILESVFMTERIIEALGRERADALYSEAQTTGFTTVREAALYCARGPSGFESPKIAIAPHRAWEFVILAIETADDALVGCTTHSYRVGKSFDALFERVLARQPGDEA
ncbi:MULTISPECIES: AbiV family abortive infection protein [unclassified Bradyrhizobium]|uniref:AbiV family abortive infection protein n=1 Tax=unclassified Bradyrhizobium TaxID=2631580 RepID=UPI0028E47E7A|nr:MULTISPECIES: AbiV family abortive infection protein [unclassified Bradyrhizobium]